MDSKRKAFIESNLKSIELKTLDFSQENLTTSDYEWLGKIIQKSSTIEVVLLPHLTQEEAALLLPILDKATTKNSILMKMEIHFATPDRHISPDLLLMKDRIQSRLQRNQKRIIGIYGGGNIGLGLFAEIVSKSPIPYQMLATSSNEFLRKLVNLKSKVWLKHDVDETNQIGSTCIDRVSMIARTPLDIIHLFQESSFIALTLKPDVFLEIANEMAQAIIKRYEKDGSGIKILILMNQPNCDQFVSKTILDELIKIVKDPSLANTIWSNIEFVPTVIDRIVSPIPTHQIKHELKKQLNNIHSDQLRATLGESNINVILNSEDLLIKAVDRFDLQFLFFKAEFNFTMHVRDDFIEANRFPLMRMSHDLTMLETIKSVYINGPHAVLAWFGALLGFETIAQAIKHPILFSFIKQMMEKEIAPILLKEYPAITNDELNALQVSFIKRCQRSVDDRVTRVGQDPLRKLNVKGRIRYPIELAEKHKLEIDTSCLLNGIAAGFLYGIKKLDPTNPGCQKINEIYEINKHSLLAVLSYTGPAPGGNFIGLSDDKLINNVISKISLLNHMSAKSKINEANQKQSSTAMILSRKINSTETNSFVPRLMLFNVDQSFGPGISRRIPGTTAKENNALFYMWMKKENKTKEDVNHTHKNTLQLRYKP